MFDRELIRMIDEMGINSIRYGGPRVRRILTFDVFYMIRQRSMMCYISNWRKVLRRTRLLSKEFRESAIHMKTLSQDIIVEYMKNYPVHEKLFIQRDMVVRDGEFQLQPHHCSGSRMVGFLTMQWDSYDILFQLEFPIDHYDRLERKGSWVYVPKWRELHTDARFDRNSEFRYGELLKSRGINHRKTDVIGYDIYTKCTPGNHCGCNRRVTTFPGRRILDRNN